MYAMNVISMLHVRIASYLGALAHFNVCVVALNINALQHRVGYTDAVARQSHWLKRLMIVGENTKRSTICIKNI